MSELYSAASWSRSASAFSLPAFSSSRAASASLCSVSREASRWRRSKHSCDSELATSTRDLASTSRSTARDSAWSKFIFKWRSSCRASISRSDMLSRCSGGAGPRLRHRARRTRHGRGTNRILRPRHFVLAIMLFLQHQRPGPLGRCLVWRRRPAQVGDQLPQRLVLLLRGAGRPCWGPNRGCPRICVRHAPSSRRTAAGARASGPGAPFASSTACIASPGSPGGGRGQRVHSALV